MEAARGLLPDGSKVGSKEDSVLPEATGGPLDIEEAECEPVAVWTNTRLCGVCQALSSYFVLRRSHCRLCGRTICPPCNAGPVPKEWLNVPYVRLCRGIPATHASEMRCCIQCAEAARLSEADYLWHHILGRPLTDGAFKAKWRAEPAEGQREVDVEVYLQQSAAALLKEYTRAVASPLPDFACKNFAHSVACHRAVSHDAKLYVFDLVYNTPKARAASAAELLEVPLDIPTLATILSRPITCDAVFDRICKYGAADDAFPSLYHLAAHENRVRFLAAATQPQRTCLHLHLPSDGAVRKTLPAGVLADAFAHRACLSSLARAARAVADLGAGAGASAGAGAVLQRLLPAAAHGAIVRS